jgi:hypothetical protein
MSAIADRARQISADYRRRYGKGYPEVHELAALVVRLVERATEASDGTLPSARCRCCGGLYAAPSASGEVQS